MNILNKYKDFVNESFHEGHYVNCINNISNSGNKMNLTIGKNYKVIYSHSLCVGLYTPYPSKLLIMNKLIKVIKLHRKLRIRQEVLFNDVCMWSWLQNPNRYDRCPKSNEFKSVNKAVRKVEKKLPNMYFILSDLFFCGSLKKLCDEAKEREHYPWEY